MTPTQPAIPAQPAEPLPQQLRRIAEHYAFEAIIKAAEEIERQDGCLATASATIRHQASALASAQAERDELRVALESEQRHSARLSAHCDKLAAEVGRLRKALEDLADYTRDVLTGPVMRRAGVSWAGGPEEHVAPLMNARAALARRGMDLSLAAIDPDEPESVAYAFGIARALAAEIAFINDDDFCFSRETPEERWQRVRKWVQEQIRADAGAPGEAR